MEILVSGLSLVYKIFLLKNDKSIAWTIGIIASILSIYYFYLVDLRIYAGLEVGLTVLMIYGLSKHKTIKMENTISIFTGIFCLFLAYLSFAGFLTLLELISSILPLVAIYYLANNRDLPGWVFMVLTCFITAYVTFEKDQVIFATYQAVSLMLALYGFKKSYNKGV